MQCKELVTWLKNWFTPKDEDYHYSLTSAKMEYNINETAIIRIDVSDGDGNPVPNHSFTLKWFGGKNNTSGTATVTSDNSGSGYYTYTCSDGGTINFNVEGYIHNINVSGLVQKKKENAGSSTPVTYTLFVDEANRHCSLTIKGNGVGIASGASNYEISGFVPSEYRSNGNKFSGLVRGNILLAYMWNNGTVGISNLASSSSSGVNLNGQIDWNY